MSNRKSGGVRQSLSRRTRPHLRFTVGTGEVQGLLSYLSEVALADRSHTTVKQLLRDRFVSVNEQPITQWDHLLSEGDVVVLHPHPLPAALTHEHLEILWQDDELLVLHKSAGLPTVASGQERDRTVMEIVSEHLKKFNPRAKVYLLNRIDKDSAGFVLMAKTEAMQQKLTEHWEQYVKRQQFVVAIEGSLLTPEGYLAAPESGTDKRKPSRRVQGSTTAGEARYRVLSTTETGSLVSIQLQRGRNNRLRKQFAELHHPILGDWRNGSRRRDLGCVALEMTALTFVHPTTGRQYDFEQPVPGRFRQWLKESLSERASKPGNNSARRK